jgi:hypothetical protein
MTTSNTSKAATPGSWVRAANTIGWGNNALLPHARLSLAARTVWDDEGFIQRAYDDSLRQCRKEQSRVAVRTFSWEQAH